MKLLFDTSILVAAMVEAHPDHERALPWLQRARRGEDKGYVASHSLAELYAILTSLPVRPGISPTVAYQMIRQNVLENCEVISLSQDDYVAIINHLSEIGITGGVTYDALILYAAIKTDVDRVLTLNERDFQRIYPELGDRISLS